MPLLPSEPGGKPPANGGLNCAVKKVVLSLPGRSLGETAGWRRRRRRKGGGASRRRRGGKAHRRRSKVYEAARSSKNTAVKETKTATKKIVKKVASAVSSMVWKVAEKAILSLLDTVSKKLDSSDRLNKGWIRLGKKAAAAYFNNIKGGSKLTLSPLRDAIKATACDGDFAILARYSLYNQLDLRKNYGGIIGSLSLDCIFTMFFYPLITQGTYVKIEHRSDTRSAKSLAGFKSKAGYEDLIQDGPFKVHVHKCKGVYHKENSTDWEPGGAYNKARQTDGCKQDGQSVEPLCTATFTLDFHYCHEFHNGKECKGPMVRKGIISNLVVDDSKREPELAECRPWFVMIDSGFRAGFSSLSAIWTSWYMRNCMYPKQSHVNQCVDGQRENPSGDSCGARVKVNKQEQCHVAKQVPKGRFS